MMLGKQDIHMQKNESRPYLTPHTKITSKWIKCQTPNHKTPTRIHRGKLPDIDLGNNFLDLTLKAQATKTKINK